MASTKPRIARDYRKMSPEIIHQIKLEYPFGFEDNLIIYQDAKGNKVSALPFEAEEVYYLVKMTKIEAQRFIEDDDDYDQSGQLKEEFAENLQVSEET